MCNGCVAGVFIYAVLILFEISVSMYQDFTKVYRKHAYVCFMGILVTDKCCQNGQRDQQILTERLLWVFLTCKTHEVKKQWLYCHYKSNFWYVLSKHTKSGWLQSLKSLEHSMLVVMSRIQI